MIMKTKQIISLAIVCLMAMMLGSCAESKLHLFAANANSKCPMKMENGSEISSVEFENNTFTYTFKVVENVKMLQMLKEHPEIAKKSFLMALGVAKSENEQGKELFDLIVEANANIQFKIKHKFTGDTLNVILTKDEIVEIVNAPELTPEEQYTQVVATMNSVLPQQVSKELTQKECLSTDKAFIIVHEIQGKDLKLKDIKKEKDTLKEVLLKQYKSRGESVLVSLLVKTGRDLVHRYKEKGSDEYVDVVMENILLSSDTE